MQKIAEKVAWQEVPLDDVVGVGFESVEVWGTSVVVVGIDDAIDAIDVDPVVILVDVVVGAIEHSAKWSGINLTTALDLGICNFCSISIHMHELIDSHSILRNTLS